MFLTFAAMCVCSFPNSFSWPCTICRRIRCLCNNVTLKLVDWGPVVMSPSPSPSLFYSWKCRASTDIAAGNNC